MQAVLVTVALFALLCPSDAILSALGGLSGLGGLGGINMKEIIKNTLMRNLKRSMCGRCRDQSMTCSPKLCNIGMFKLQCAKTCQICTPCDQLNGGGGAGAGGPPSGAGGPSSGAGRPPQGPGGPSSGAGGPPSGADKKISGGRRSSVVTGGAAGRYCPPCRDSTGYCFDLAQQGHCSKSLIMMRCRKTCDACPVCTNTATSGGSSGGAAGPGGPGGASGAGGPSSPSGPGGPSGTGGSGASGGSTGGGGATATQSQSATKKFRPDGKIECNPKCHDFNNQRCDAWNRVGLCKLSSSNTYLDVRQMCQKSCKVCRVCVLPDGTTSDKFLPK